MARGLRIFAMGLTAAAVLTAAAGASAQPPQKPRRIISMNLCADMMVLQLVPRDRIAAVTYLAHDGAQALFPGADAGIAINHGTAEDIVNLRPDLIVADNFSTGLTRRLAARVGAPIIEVKDALTFDEIRRNLRQVGAAVGEPARAEALIRRMDATLANLTAHPRARPVRVIAWSGGDSVPGRATLTNRIIETAGAVNIAAPPGGGYSTLSVEQVLAARPDALLHAGGPSDHPSLRGEEARHRALTRLYQGRRFAYDEIASTCGLPQSADAARRLAQDLDGLS